MPNRIQGQNTGRKHNVVLDDYGIHGPGVYAIGPSLNRGPGGVEPIKIGESKRLEQRITSYNAYYLKGVYIYAMLYEIDTPRGKTDRQHRQHIEKWIIDDIVQKPRAKRLYSKDRIRHPNERKEGETEWVLAHQKQVIQSFRKATREFNCSLVIGLKREKQAQEEGEFIAKIVF